MKSDRQSLEREREREIGWRTVRLARVGCLESDFGKSSWSRSSQGM